MNELYLKYDAWTKEFMESWKELDWERTLKTLDKNVKYYENPIDSPCSSFDDVIKLWNVVADNQKFIFNNYYDENINLYYSKEELSGIVIVDREKV